MVESYADKSRTEEMCLLIDAISGKIDIKL